MKGSVLQDHRHQCLIYEGAPSRQLDILAAAAKDRLRAGHRCLYLNSPVMVAGMRSYLAASGLDVAAAEAAGSLVLSSGQQHLDGGRFDVDRLIAMLESSLSQALSAGFAGLWATGDIAWELGPQRDYSRLMEYERKLDAFLRRHPQLSGICQYHVDTLPQIAVQTGYATHPSFFVNENRSMFNPDYLPD